MCAEFERTARIPPVILGCMVLTRPSSISGKPVTSATSRTGTPESRMSLAVPPVEITSTPNSSVKARAKDTMFVLSVTLSSARVMMGMNYSVYYRGGLSPLQLTEYGLASLVHLEFGKSRAIRYVEDGMKKVASIVLA